MNQSSSQPDNILTCQKHLFSLPEGLHYLNCAYMSPLPRRVEAAGIKGIRAKRAPSGIKPAHFFGTSHSVRSLFAGLIGAREESIAIVPAASYGIATAARNVAIKAGQRIVVLEEQFPSNIYSWQRLAGETGAELYAVSPPERWQERGRSWNERILEAIDSRTALVAIAHVHWADGTLFDLEAVGRRARDVGAALIVDGTQSVGAFPFDVTRIQPDALICAGYKWLLAPYGIGVAYYGPRFIEGIPLEENWIARKGSERFDGLVRYTEDYQPGAVRFDVGERGNFILLPMLESALKHLTEWGIPRIQTYCERLVREFLGQVREYGFFVEEDAWRASHLFGVRVRNDISMERLMSNLQDENVSVSVRGTAVRISPNVYNDQQDIETLCSVFERVVQKANSRR